MLKALHVITSISLAAPSDSADKDDVALFLSWQKLFWSSRLRLYFFLFTSAALLLQSLKRLCVLGDASMNLLTVYEHILVWSSCWLSLHDDGSQISQ